MATTVETTQVSTTVTPPDSDVVTVTATPVVSSISVSNLQGPAGPAGPAGTPTVAYAAHGSTASTARPTSNLVLWSGTVVPTNALSGDLWDDTAQGFVKRRVGTRWRSRNSLLPSEIPNIKGWWPIDELALSNNAPISSLPDASGNGFTMTQATGSLQPLFRTNAQNGLGSAVFDGVNDYLGSVAIGALPQPITVAAVVRQVSGANRYIDTMDGSIRFGFDVNGPNIYSGTGAGSIGVPGMSPVVILESVTRAVVSTSNGASSLIFHNGQQVGGGDAGAANATGGLTIGGGGSTQVWKGHIMEAAVFTRALTTGESLAVMRYLQGKWGC